MSFLATTSQAAADASWHYAGWIAVDVRLLGFLALLAVLGSTGVCLIVVRRRNLLHTAAVFIVSFTLLFVALVTVFNTLAHYPVFVVEAFFPFP